MLASGDALLSVDRGARGEDKATKAIAVGGIAEEDVGHGRGQAGWGNRYDGDVDEAGFGASEAVPVDVTRATNRVLAHRSTDGEARVGASEGARCLERGEAADEGIAATVRIGDRVRGRAASVNLGEVWGRVDRALRRSSSGDQEGRAEYRGTRKRVDTTRENCHLELLEL